MSSILNKGAIQQGSDEYGTLRDIWQTTRSSGTRWAVPMSTYGKYLPDVFYYYDEERDTYFLRPIHNHYWHNNLELENIGDNTIVFVSCYNGDGVERALEKLSISIDMNRALRSLGDGSFLILHEPRKNKTIVYKRGHRVNASNIMQFLEILNDKEKMNITFDAEKQMKNLFTKCS